MINLGKIINNPLATKIGSIADLANYTMSAANAYMVKPEIPQFDNQGEISGFLFDVKGGDEINLKADITDHYAENNVALQDHIGIKPITVTVSGFVGEVRTKYDPQTWQNTITNYTSKSSALAFMAPEITTQAKATFNQMERLYGLYEKANDTTDNLFKTFKGTASSQTDTRQQEAFQYFKTAWQTRQPFKIQTPWQSLDQMFITTLKATQNDETKYITEFEITFKQIRFASTITRGLTQDEKDQMKADRLKAQSLEQQDKGTQNGTNTSFAKGLLREGAKNIKVAAKEIYAKIK